MLWRMSMTLGELAERIGAEVRGEGGRAVSACAALDDATAEQVSFLANAKYADRLATTQAGAVILSPADSVNAPSHLALLVADDAYFAFRQAMVALHGFREHPQPGVSELACVDPSATLGQDVVIQPFVHVAAGAVVGDRTVIYPHCSIGPDARVGADCQLYPNVTVYDRCVLGDRVTLHAGCVIGQDGFGYATHQREGEGVRHHKIPQVGNAVIEDDVEMGAGCAVDRATVGSTVIGTGTKFSDLIAIGHGAKVGRHNLFVAQAGIAGSTDTGAYVVLGGQVGVAGHLKIGDGVQLAAKSGVMDDIPAGEKWGGQPAMPLQFAKRNYLTMLRMADMPKKFKELLSRVEQLEKKLAEKDG